MPLVRTIGLNPLSDRGRAELRVVGGGRPAHGHRVGREDPAVKAAEVAEIREVAPLVEAHAHVGVAQPGRRPAAGVAERAAKGTDAELRGGRGAVVEEEGDAVGAGAAIGGVVEVDDDALRGAKRLVIERVARLARLRRRETQPAVALALGRRREHGVAAEHPAGRGRVLKRLDDGKRARVRGAGTHAEEPTSCGEHESERAPQGATWVPGAHISQIDRRAVHRSAG